MALLASSQARLGELEASKVEGDHAALEVTRLGLQLEQQVQR